MMLRSRNPNNINNIIVAQQKPGDLVAKRGKKQAIVPDENLQKGEPKPKRAAFADLSHAISNVLIDSSKKSTVVEKKPIVRRSGRRSNSATEPLQAIKEHPLSENEEPSLIEKPVEVDPCPSYDYDAENNADPNNVPEYAFDIFKYYRSRELNFSVGDYLKRQNSLTKETRAVLADWMVEVQETFELNHETLYLAVKITDLYLDRTDGVTRDDLQLIASAAIFIASKFDERSPPLIDDFLYICEESFDREALILMEMKVLDTIGYDLGCPLSYRYVRRYARVSKTDMPTLTLARYILETSLMFYELLGVSESLMAAAAFLLAIKMKDKSAIWTSVLHKYSGYTSSEVEPLMWELNHMMHVRSTTYSRLLTVFSKYSHEVFFQSAAVELLPDKFSKNRAVQAPAFASV